MSRLVNSARCNAYMSAWIAAEKWVTDSVAMWGSCCLLASIRGCAFWRFAISKGALKTIRDHFEMPFKDAFAPSPRELCNSAKYFVLYFHWKANIFGWRNQNRTMEKLVSVELSKDCLKIMYCHQGRSLFLPATQSQWLIFPWQKRFMNHDQSIL